MMEVNSPLHRGRGNGQITTASILDFTLISTHNVLCQILPKILVGWSFSQTNSAVFCPRTEATSLS